MKKEKASIRIVTAAMALMLLIITVVPAFSFDGIKKVKVGFFAYPGYHEEINNSRGGYGYDFLMLLQRYTNLNYEFVGYENSWEDMQQMLLNGEIDLVTSARKTAAREKLFDFSEPIGTNSALINTRADDERFIPGDYAALDGITIGELRGNSRNADVEAFAAEKGFTYKVKEYETADELSEALQSSDVDAIAASSLRKSTGEKTVAEFAPQDFFVIVRKGDKDLLREINYGIYRMDISEGNWRDDLHYRNYKEDAETILTFSQREKDYIKAVQSGEKTITVTARPDMDPYSFMQMGKLTGIIPDYFGHLMGMAGLPYTTVAAKNAEEYSQWAVDSHTDVVMDCRYGSSPSRDFDFGLVTDPYITLTTSLVTQKSFTGDIQTVAIVEPRNTLFIEEYPAAGVECIFVSSQEDALKAVRDGEADACCVLSCTAEKFINKDPDNTLQATVLNNSEINEYIYVSPETDHELCSILNKCIKADSKGFLDECIRRYTTVTPDKLTPIQYLKFHPLLTIFAALGFVVIIAFISILSVRANKEYVRNKHLKKELEQKAELDESLTFTNFFLDTYVSAYYVNFDDMSCRVYKRTRQLEEDYPIIDNYYESLSEYIRNAVFPDDIEGLLAVCEPEKMRSLLREKEEYSHDFRDISSGEERIYRMQVIRGAEEGHAAFGFKDVTDEVRNQHKRLLGAVQLSPELLSKADIGLWAFELDEGMPPRMYVDETMLPLIGLTEQILPEETYHAWYDHIDPDCYDLVTEAVDKMTNGEHAEVQYPWHHPDGHTMIVRCGGIRNFNYKKGIRIEGTHQNVSEVLHFDEQEVERYKQAEIQLRHEQLRSEVLNYMINNEDDPIELLKNYAERLRVLINCDQVIYRDLEETRIMVNSPAIEETWCVPMEYCLQCQHLDAHHPMYAGGYTEMENCQEGWQGIPVYEKCPIKSSLTRIVYCDGEIAGYLAIHYVQNYHKFTDIERATLEEFTRILSISLSRFEARKENKELKLLNETRKQLEEQLVLSDGLAREYHTVWLVESVPPCKMHLFRSTGVKTRKSAVQLGLDCVGYDEGVRVYVRDYIHEEDRERVAEQVKFETVARETPENGTYVVTYRRYNSDRTDYDYHQMCFARAVSEDGTVNFILAFRDADKLMREQIAQQKQLADALSQAQIASKSKTEFLFNMSHDIRTPMNAIVGFTNMALKHIDEKDKVVDSLEKTKQASDLLLSLINSILDMSRIESGKATVEENKGDVTRSFENVETTMGDLARSKDISLKFEIGDIRDRYVYYDHNRCVRIFVNIISNAIKYTPDGGRVHVKCEQIASENGVGTYRYTFADTGIGMSEEFQKHVFEEFSREQNSTTSGIQGTGLGLAVCKSFTELMGGTIDCQSEQGVGTIFTVTLPFRLRSPEGAEAFEETQDDGRPVAVNFRGRKALLVEDNELNREIAIDILEEEGIIVEEAEDGSVAVEMMREKGPDYYDFVLMDIQMPIMNGYEATGEIRKMYPGSRLPIIALSANAFAEDRARSVEAGMNDHVAKPIDVATLKSTLARYLR